MLTLYFQLRKRTMYKMRWVTGSAKHYCLSTSTFCFCLDRAWASNQIQSTRFDRPDVLVCVHPFSVPSAVACVTVSVRPDRLLMSSRPQGRVASCGLRSVGSQQMVLFESRRPKIISITPTKCSAKSPTKYVTKSATK